MPTIKLEQPTVHWGFNVAPVASRRVDIDPRARYHVIPDFSPLAQRMRAQFERHFAEPHAQGPTHQVWNYWYVPGSYTYLRTDPSKVIGQELVDRFMHQLTEFTVTRLGMDDVTRPWLSLYVDGFGQALHNDARNGSIGYVFSLTRWDKRKFSGGETMLFHQQDYWASGRFRSAGATSTFYELVPALFNQLLLFDDRVPHSVPMIRGVVDPCEARVVMHGHITARRLIVRGPLGEPRHLQGGSMQQLAQWVQQFVEAHRGRVHGFATFAVNVGRDGVPHDVRVLIDRVLPLPGAPSPAAITTHAGQQLSALRFDATEGESTVMVPLVFT